MKKGITISILAVTIVIMFILVTTATVIGVRTIQTASYEEFMSKIQRITNDVNSYVIANGELPTNLEIIAKEGLPNAIIAELNSKDDAGNNLYVLDMSKLKTESVNIGKGTIADLDVFVVAENTNNVYYLKGVNYRGTTYHGAKTPSRFNKDGVPIIWEENVIAIVDTVPIPKGFVASQATGENTKDGGLVIYEGTEAVTDANVETAKRSRNQYVWIPVENFSNFVRKDFGVNQKISNTLGRLYWEIVTGTVINMPLPTQDSAYITSTTLTEVQAMYESVKEYKGFYVARYEAGIDSIRSYTNYIDDEGNVILEDKVYSVMGKYPYIYLPWTSNTNVLEDDTGVVWVARSQYPKDNMSYGVSSTLIYGVQWDAIMQWWLDTKAVSSLIDSTNYGNYANHEVTSYTQMNDGAKFTTNVESTKPTYRDVTESFTKKGSYVYTTGALKAAKVNNTYDIAGNVAEWTMQGYSTNQRVFVGGWFGMPGAEASVSMRWGSKMTAYANGFRVALYIK